MSENDKHSELTPYYEIEQNKNLIWAIKSLQKSFQVKVVCTATFKGGEERPEKTVPDC